MSWTCADLRRWLDDGRPRENDVTAGTHASGCPSCRAALAAARSLEEALVLSPATRAPTGFTDAVMRRVAAAGAERGAGAGRVGGERVVPWWARLAAEPAVVVPCAIALLLVWRWSTVWGLATRLSPRVTAWAEVSERWGGRAAVEVGGALHALNDPAVALGLVLAACPLVVWASWHLARWSEQALARPLVRAGRERG